MRVTLLAIRFRSTMRPMLLKKTIPYLYMPARALDSCLKCPFLLPSSLIILIALMFSLRSLEKSLYRVYRLSITIVKSWVLYRRARVTIEKREA